MCVLQLLLLATVVITASRKHASTLCTPRLPPSPYTIPPSRPVHPSCSSLYLMEGLTTRFTRPAPPKPAVVTRETLGIPRQPPPISAAGGIGVPDDGVAERGDGEHGQLPPSCGALYVVPQTLYKLHPDFDRLVAGVLSADLSGCVVFIRAVEATTTESVARRMSRALLAAGVAAERIIFVPRWVGCQSGKKTKKSGRLGRQFGDQFPVREKCGQSGSVVGLTSARSPPLASFRRQEATQSTALTD